MYSYKKLEEKLKSLGKSKSDLTKDLRIFSRTIAKLSKGERIANHVLVKIASFLCCNAADLFFEICNNPISQALREEKEHKVPGGIYHELQVRMAYNSNHIEGSTLTEEETCLIFETGSIQSKNALRIDDLIEAANHFRALDYVIDAALLPLSEEIIKRLHLLLRQGTGDSSLDWFAVGECKERENMVGGKAICPVKDVEKEMRSLLGSYSAKEVIAFEDIVSYHAEFEAIHPFQDENGRVGRLITVKECLKYGVTPFLIEDSKKAFYYRGPLELKPR